MNTCTFASKFLMSKRSDLSTRILKLPSPLPVVRTSAIPVASSKYLQLSQLYDSGPSSHRCSLKRPSKYGSVNECACYAYHIWYFIHCKAACLPRWRSLHQISLFRLECANYCKVFEYILKKEIYLASLFDIATQRCSYEGHVTSFRWEWLCMSQ